MFITCYGEGAGVEEAAEEVVDVLVTVVVDVDADVASDEMVDEGVVVVLVDVALVVVDVALEVVCVLVVFVVVGVVGTNGVVVDVDVLFAVYVFNGVVLVELEVVWLLTGVVVDPVVVVVVTLCINLSITSLCHFIS